MSPKPQKAEAGQPKAIAKETSSKTAAKRSDVLRRPVSNLKAQAKVQKKPAGKQDTNELSQGSAVTRPASSLVKLQSSQSELTLQFGSPGRARPGPGSGPPLRSGPGTSLQSLIARHESMDSLAESLGRRFDRQREFEETAEAANLAASLAPEREDGSS